MASGPQDRNGLRASLHELPILAASAYDTPSEGGEKFPKDPAERAKRFLEKLNILSHRYPFPKAIEASSGIFSSFHPKPIIFTDIETLRQWLNDLKIFTVEYILHYHVIFNNTVFKTYIDALAIREKESIEKLKNNPFGIGEINPYNIVNDFIKNIDRAGDIYYSTSAALDRADKLKANLVSSNWTATILLIGFAVFITGVCLPFFSSRLHAFFYIHFPLLYFLGVCP
jgi:hypothetical protein